MQKLPFDAERARQGHPVCTRDDRPAVFISDVSQKDYPLHFKIGEKRHLFSTKGEFLKDEAGVLDLFLVDTGEVLTRECEQQSDRNPETNHSDMIYIAIPYSFDPDFSFNLANKVAAEYIDNGEVVYSPVSMFHHISRHTKADPKDSLYWLKQCLPMVKQCKKVVVVVPENYLIGINPMHLIRDSKGVQAEIKEAFLHNIPVEYRKF